MELPSRTPGEERCWGPRARPVACVGLCASEAPCCPEKLGRGAFGVSRFLHEAQRCEPWRRTCLEWVNFGNFSSQSEKSCLQYTSHKLLNPEVFLFCFILVFFLLK